MLDELEGFYTDAEVGEVPPEELVRRNVGARVRATAAQLADVGSPSDDGGDTDAGAHARMEIDFETPRSYLHDLCGTAAFAGYGAALVDVAEVKSASGEELLATALRFGVDPTEFEAHKG